MHALFVFGIYCLVSETFVHLWQPHCTKHKSYFEWQCYQLGRKLFKLRCATIGSNPQIFQFSSSLTPFCYFLAFFGSFQGDRTCNAGNDQNKSPKRLLLSTYFKKFMTKSHFCIFLRWKHFIRIVWTNDNSTANQYHWYCPIKNDNFRITNIVRQANILLYNFERGRGGYSLYLKLLSWHFSVFLILFGTFWNLLVFDITLFRHPCF